MVAWYMNLASLTDLTFGLIAVRVGPDKVRGVVPAWQPVEPTTIPERQQNRRGPANSFPIDVNALNILARGSFPMGFLSANRNFREQTGNRGGSGGSNCWVVGPRKIGRASCRERVYVLV